METYKHATDVKTSVNGDVFKALVEESPVPHGLYVGHNMVIAVANEAMLKIWGCDGSVIGKPYRDILSQPQLTTYTPDEVYASGVSAKITEERVEMVVKGHLQVFYFDFTYTPLKDANGTVWGVLHTATDVTELVETRHKLAASELQTEFALDAAQSGTWEMDPHRYCFKWDERSRQLLGANVSENVSFEEASAFINPDDLDRVQKAIIYALDPYYGGKYSVEFRTGDLEDGSERWLLGKGRAYFNSEGYAYRFAGTIVDITVEVKVRQEREKLLALVENSADAMAVANLDAEVIYINEACRQLLGFKERTGLRVPDFYPADEFEWVRDNVWPAVAEHGSWAGNLTLKHAATGEDIPVIANFISINDPISGGVIGRGATLRDMRPEIEAQLEQRKLLALIENTDDLIAVADLNNNLFYINKAGQDLLGATCKEPIPYTDILSEEDKAVFATEVKDVLDDWGRWSGTLRYRHLLFDETIVCFANIFVINDAVTGKAVGIATVARDLRPELATQKALADSEQLFRDITTAAPAALWMTDVEGNITYVNQIWANWTGMPLEWHLGNGWRQAIVPEDQERVKQIFDHDFELRTLHECEFRIKDRYGNERYVVCTGNPQYDPQLNFKGYIGALADITEQKHLQSQKDEFLSIASHELKTPITSMKAYLQILSKMLEANGDQSFINFAAKANRQVNKLTTLINDLLDVTKIQAGKMVLNMVPVDMNELVNSFNEQHLLPEKHHISVEGSCDVMVEGDRPRLEQVMENLISNAGKYSPDSDRIVIKIEQLPSWVKISVTDFGIGIPQEKLSLVFDRFFRVEKTSQQFSGLGLGLFISHEIVKQHGGEMGVTSKEGDGSTFWFTLPAS